MKSIEKKPRRIVIAILSVCVIAYMWIKKDVLGLWTEVGAEDALPFLVTNIGVTLIKIAVLAAAVYFIKKIAVKIANKSK